MIHVVIADDHEVVRAGFRMLLEADPDVRVVGEAADGQQAYDLVLRERPEVLLMDISMPPGQSGLIACERITGAFPSTRVLIVTMFAEPEYLYFTLRSGAAGYLLKNSSAAELRSAVHAVAEGGTYLHPKMAGELTRRLAQEGEGGSGDASYRQLTTRELEVLQLLARGFTNKEISEQVYLSVKTVEAYRSRIYAKLGFSSRADLVAYAIRHKLLNL